MDKIKAILSLKLLSVQQSLIEGGIFDRSQPDDQKMIFPEVTDDMMKPTKVYADVKGIDADLYKKLQGIIAKKTENDIGSDNTVKD